MDNKSESLYNALPRRPKLSDLVVEQIEESISSGKLQPGERLPPERELAEQFKVSRTAIRESIRSLTAKGLLEVRAGSGAYVSVPGTKQVSESMSLILRLSTSKDLYAQVFQVRRLLEVEIAGLAAKWAKEDDIEMMEEAVRTMETECDQGVLAECDVDFHAALANASQNELYPILLDSVVDIMIEIRRMALMNPGARDEAMNSHRKILERVKNKDVEGARLEMLSHMKRGEEFMRNAIETQKNRQTG